MLATELGVIGLMNVQFAVHGGEVYVLEVNPRASRTIPFVSKAIGKPLAKIAAKVMAGKTLAELGMAEVEPRHVSVKEVVFPFVKFEGVDTILGPEMRSTGEVMGIDSDFARAFAKSQLAAGMKLPTKRRRVPLGARSRQARARRDRAPARQPRLHARRDARHRGVPRASTASTSRGINKVLEGRPHCVDAMDNHEIDFVINTTEGAQAIQDSQSLRRAALMNGIAYYTTLRAREGRARGDRGREARRHARAGAAALRDAV